MGSPVCDVFPVYLTVGSNKLVFSVFFSVYRYEVYLDNLNPNPQSYLVKSSHYQFIQHNLGKIFFNLVFAPVTITIVNDVSCLSF
jgi:hypothetical protein